MGAISPSTVELVLEACMAELCLMGEPGLKTMDLWEAASKATGLDILKLNSLQTAVLDALKHRSDVEFTPGTLPLIKATTHASNAFLGVSTEPISEMQQRVLFTVAQRSVDTRRADGIHIPINHVYSCSRTNGISALNISKITKLTAKQVSHLVKALIIRKLIVRVKVQSVDARGAAIVNPLCFLPRFCPKSQQSLEAMEDQMQTMASLIEQIPGGILRCDVAASLLGWNVATTVEFCRFAAFLSSIRAASSTDYNMADEEATDVEEETATVTTTSDAGSLSAAHHAILLRPLLFHIRHHLLHVNVVMVPTLVEVDTCADLLQDMHVTMSDNEEDKATAAADGSQAVDDAASLSSASEATSYTSQFRPCFQLVAPDMHAILLGKADSSTTHLQSYVQAFQHNHSMFRSSLPQARTQLTSPDEITHTISAELSMPEQFLRHAATKPDGISQLEFATITGGKRSVIKRVFLAATQSSILRKHVISQYKTQLTRSVFPRAVNPQEWDPQALRELCYQRLADRGLDCSAVPHMAGQLFAMAAAEATNNAAGADAASTSPTPISKLLNLKEWSIAHPGELVQRSYRRQIIVELLDAVKVCTLRDTSRCLQRIEHTLRERGVPYIALYDMDMFTLQRIATDLCRVGVLKTFSFTPAELHDRGLFRGKLDNQYFYRSPLFVIAHPDVNQTDDKVMQVLQASALATTAELPFDTAEVEAFTAQKLQDLIAANPSNDTTTRVRTAGADIQADLASEVTYGDMLLFKRSDSVGKLCLWTPVSWTLPRLKRRLVSPQEEDALLRLGTDSYPISHLLRELQIATAKMIKSHRKRRNVAAIEAHTVKASSSAAESTTTNAQPAVMSAGEGSFMLPEVDVDVPEIPIDEVSFADSLGEVAPQSRRRPVWTPDDYRKLINAVAWDRAWRELSAQKRYEYELAKYKRYRAAITASAADAGPAKPRKGAAQYAETEPHVMRVQTDWGNVGKSLGVDAPVAQRTFKRLMLDAAVQTTVLNALDQKRQEVGVTLYSGVTSKPIIESKMGEASASSKRESATNLIPQKLQQYTLSNTAASMQQLLGALRTLRGNGDPEGAEFTCELARFGFLNSTLMVLDGESQSTPEAADALVRAWDLYKSVYDILSNRPDFEQAIQSLALQNTIVHRNITKLRKRLRAKWTKSSLSDAELSAAVAAVVTVDAFEIASELLDIFQIQVNSPFFWDVKSGRSLTQPLPSFSAATGDQAWIAFGSVMCNQVKATVELEEVATAADDDNASVRSDSEAESSEDEAGGVTRLQAALARLKTIDTLETTASDDVVMSDKQPSSLHTRACIKLNPVTAQAETAPPVTLPEPNEIFHHKSYFDNLVDHSNVHGMTVSEMDALVKFADVESAPLWLVAAKRIPEQARIATFLRMYPLYTSTSAGGDDADPIVIIYCWAGALAIRTSHLSHHQLLTHSGSTIIPHGWMNLNTGDTDTGVLQRLTQALCNAVWEQPFIEEERLVRRMPFNAANTRMLLRWLCLKGIIRMDGASDGASCVPLAWFGDVSSSIESVNPCAAAAPIRYIPAPLAPLRWRQLFGMN